METGCCTLYFSMIVCLYGPPGCGKGTVSSVLEKNGFFIFTPGNVIRKELEQNGPYAQILRDVNGGSLAPDDFIRMITKDAIRGHKNIVLDGVPRSRAQAVSLKNELRDAVNIVFDISKAECAERVLKRKVCPSCQRSIMPGSSSCQDHPEERPVIRGDDNEHVFEKRWSVFENETAPIIPQNAFKIDASQGIDSVVEMALLWIESMSKMDSFSSDMTPEH